MNLKQQAGVHELHTQEASLERGVDKEGGSRPNNSSGITQHTQQQQQQQQQPPPPLSSFSPTDRLRESGEKVDELSKSLNSDMADGSLGVGVDYLASCEVKALRREGWLVDDGMEKTETQQEMEETGTQQVFLGAVGSSGVRLGGESTSDTRKNNLLGFTYGNSTDTERSNGIETLPPEEEKVLKMASSMSNPTFPAASWGNSRTTRVFSTPPNDAPHASTQSVFIREGLSQVLSQRTPALQKSPITLDSDAPKPVSPSPAINSSGGGLFSVASSPSPTRPQRTHQLQLAHAVLQSAAQSHAAAVAQHQAQAKLIAVVQDLITESLVGEGGFTDPNLGLLLASNALSAQTTSFSPPQAMPLEKLSQLVGFPPIHGGGGTPTPRSTPVSSPESGATDGTSGKVLAAPNSFTSGGNEASLLKEEETYTIINRTAPPRNGVDVAGSSGSHSSGPLSTTGLDREQQELLNKLSLLEALERDTRLSLSSTQTLLTAALSAEQGVEP